MCCQKEIRAIAAKAGYFLLGARRWGRSNLSAIKCHEFMESQALRQNVFRRSNDEIHTLRIQFELQSGQPNCIGTVRSQGGSANAFLAADSVGRFGKDMYTSLKGAHTAPSRLCPHWKYWRWTRQLGCQDIDAKIFLATILETLVARSSGGSVVDEDLFPSLRLGNFQTFKVARHCNVNMKKSCLTPQVIGRTPILYMIVWLPGFVGKSNCRDRKGSGKESDAQTGTNIFQHRIPTLRL